ncbi:hypothetical protein OROGR_028868 [Orobanche gracilis]
MGRMLLRTGIEASALEKDISTFFFFTASPYQAI